MTEVIVERCARLLLSNRPDALMSIANYFEGLSGDSRGSRKSANELSWMLQDLLAYKRGAVVDHLLQQIATSPAPPDVKTIVGLKRLYLCKMMAGLSENEAVAKYCVKEKLKARTLAKALLEAQAHLLREVQLQVGKKGSAPDQLIGSKKRGEEEKLSYLNLAVENVKGFANFSYASKTFRLALQASEDFFPGLASLLDHEITKHSSAQLLVKTFKYFFDLLRGFITFEDSQNWALDKGAIRIYAELTRLLSISGVTERFVEDLQAAADIVSGPGPASRDMRKHFAALGDELRLLDRCIRDPEDPQGARKLREQWLEQDVLPGLLLLGSSTVRGESGLPPDRVQNALDMAANTFKRMKGSFASTPIVCSWERCDIGSVLEAGRPFSKCANCSFAFYCR